MQTRSSRKKRLLGLALAGVVLIAVVVVLTGGDTRFGLSEAKRKDLIETYVADGGQAEAAALSQHPGDEDEQMKVLRASLDAIHARILTKYGVTHDQADEIFREARQKGWW